jgi:DNA-nicking Smr family endonuclease
LKKSVSSKRFRSFEELKRVFKNKSVIREPDFPKRKEKNEKDIFEAKPKVMNIEEEKKIFLKAMEGVTPISNNKHIDCLCRKDRYDCEEPELDPNPAPDPDLNPDILTQMEQLIDEGKGFTISATPEYHQGAGYNVHPEMMTRLHQGEFSIQDYIDLHGCTLDYAEEILEQFFKKSIRKGTRSVLIVHGRGLSSKDEPVLKNRVIEKLSVGKWRKWVIAYTSAERYDGGTGATYVLLRKHPVPRRIRKTTTFCSL